MITIISVHDYQIFANHKYKLDDYLILSPEIHRIMHILDAGKNSRGYTFLKGVGCLDGSTSHTKYTIFDYKPNLK